MLKNGFLNKLIPFYIYLCSYFDCDYTGKKRNSRQGLYIREKTASNPHLEAVLGLVELLLTLIDPCC